MAGRDVRGVPWRSVVLAGLNGRAVLSELGMPPVSQDRPSIRPRLARREGAAWRKLEGGQYSDAVLNGLIVLTGRPDLA
jgi:hypothetical protein